MNLRTTPTQQRANERADAFLDAAADLLLEVGYDLLTMKAVAERTSSSIGALYRYFPNKYELASALCHRYVEELELAWAPLIIGVPDLSVAVFAERMIGVVEAFVERRPAYFALKAARVSFRRDPTRRADLREHIASAFLAREPKLPSSRATLLATVTVQIINGMLVEMSLAQPRNRYKLRTEFQLVLQSYLDQALK